ILDRLVGFELSPILWQKIKPSLSAGRVQSVTVRLIVEREREIGDFKSQSSFKVVALFDIKKKGTNYTLKADLPGKLNNAKEAEDFLSRCKGADFKIVNLEKKPSKRSPAAPFTTSTLQQEASRKLGFSVARTMTVAQKLYESGKITYMRTDSVNLSQTAVSEAKAEIEKSFGKEYSFKRQFTTKSKGAQEAHEAIRPTYLNKSSVSGDSSEQRLYDLIWKRTIASQMADAQIEKTIATISISGLNERLIAQGEVIKFDGFLKVYMESSDEETEENAEGMLPPIAVGEVLDLKTLTATERFTHHPPRYTEASLVKKLEELGIGRPSTYAPTISTVQKRGYVVKEEREGKERQYQQMVLKSGAISKEKKKEITGAEKNKLFPTDIGIVVNDFLVENFKNILDYNFTAQVEKEFDEIAQGDKVWNEMIRSFYTPFHENVEHTEKVSERAKGERELGKDPKSGKPIIAKIGRYGPLIQIGTVDDEEKPLFARMRTTQRIETITLEEAMELFKLPRTIGTYEDEDVKANVGRFGPYILHNKVFYSIPKGEDPLDITFERAVEIIEAKRKAEREKLIKTFPERDDTQVLKGRYGPYISFGERNLRIPKGVEPSSLTLEQILDIEKTQEPSKSKKRVIRKKK
ncbi:MAG: DNA topoisomerase, partial [Bacteroidia bacterium]